jgi:DNA topoisomerase-1
MGATTGANASEMGATTGANASDPDELTATLVAVDGRRVATGRDFDATGRLTVTDLVHLDEPAARGLADRLGSAQFAVRRVEEKPYRRRPPAPFMTSTLQQEASRKLRFTGARTMRVAQSLYEAGYITYMRTDSTTLSQAALAAARSQARELYGAQSVPDAPRRYEKKVKNAQEAHEAIRPSGDTFRTPEQVNGHVGRDEARLYELVWQRTVASQMVDATGRSVSLRLGGVSTAGEDAEFAATGTVITTPGWLRAYTEGTDGEEATEGHRRLPQVAEGHRLDVRALAPSEHATTPPARYTDATLVRALEEAGVGRPSTYAAIITTIIDRGYVFRKGSALVPSFTAFAVVGLLEEHFRRLVDYGFTARLEDELDDIASGQQESVPWLTRFYFGTPDGAAGPPGPDGDEAGAREGLKSMVSQRLGEIDAREVNSIALGADTAGRPIVVRVGRYGPYLQRDDDRASVPEDTVPDELTIEAATELLDAPSGDKVLGSDPDSGLDVLARTGRYGPYVTLSLPEGSTERPKTVSLLRSQSIDSLSLDDALALLSLPRSLGTDPDTGEEVLTRLGRYGPYVTRGSDSRSLESEEALFTLDLEAARQLFAQPKRRGRAAASSAPLRELGEDPASGKAVVVKDGRFGPYVTDGETNASLRKSDAPDSVTLERAGELLAERRAKGPAKKGPRTAKKTAKKAASQRSTAKKPAGKKTAPRKKP